MSRVCLNFGRDWDEVGNIVTAWSGGKPSGWVKDAFKGGTAEKILIKAGTLLYKFNDFPVLVDMGFMSSRFGVTVEGSVTISPWWTPYNAFPPVGAGAESIPRSGLQDPGWLAKRALAARFGVSIREWGRITSAVKENWNSLRYLMVIGLKHDAYGWFGGFSAMSRIDPGGASKRLAGEGGVGLQSGLGRATGSQWMTGRSAERGFTSAGMRERHATVGTRGSLAGGGTQFYIPNVRMINVGTWRVEDLAGQ